jgi:hypothetical protein
MHSRRLEITAALAAPLLVLPALVLLIAAALRLLQPKQYQPAAAANEIFGWFVSLRAGPLVLIVGPLFALILGLFVLRRQFTIDERLRADTGLFLAVSGRLLRRPIFLSGALVALSSLAVLAFVATHALAG